MKKLLSFIIAVLLVFVYSFGAFGVTASALTSGYYTYTISNGEATITECDVTISGDVIIPSILGGCSVTAIGNNAFLECENITSVIIPYGVKSLGYGVFWGCSQLVSAVIPDSVTSIDIFLFKECYKLTNVTIPDGLTVISQGMFWNCKSLDTFVLPDSLTDIQYGAFNGCESLYSIVIPKNVTKLGNGAFNGCSSLTSVMYGGSELDRSQITVGSGNVHITNATWYYCAPGDINGDFAIDLLDVACLERYLADWVGYNDQTVALEMADMNMDGTLDNLDVLCFLNKLTRN